MTLKVLLCAEGGSWCYVSVVHGCDEVAGCCNDDVLASEPRTWAFSDCQLWRWVYTCHMVIDALGVPRTTVVFVIISAMGFLKLYRTVLINISAEFVNFEIGNLNMSTNSYVQILKLNVFAHYFVKMSIWCVVPVTDDMHCCWIRLLCHTWLWLIKKFLT